MQGTPGMNWLQILKTNDLPENDPVISVNINIVMIFKSLQYNDNSFVPNISLYIRINNYQFSCSNTLKIDRSYGCYFILTDGADVVLISNLNISLCITLLLKYRKKSKTWLRA